MTSHTLKTPEAGLWKTQEFIQCYLVSQTGVSINHVPVEAKQYFHTKFHYIITILLKHWHSLLLCAQQSSKPNMISWAVWFDTTSKAGIMVLGLS